MEETLGQDVSHFDLSKPHMRITGENGVVTIVQNGFIYAYSIPDIRRPMIGGKVIGKIDAMKAAARALGHKFCDFCGYSFGLAEGLEEHLYGTHRDILLVSIIQHRPGDLKLGELPTEGQLKGEATRIVKGEEAEEILAKQTAKNAHPAVKAYNASKARTKGAYREPLRA